MVQGFCPLKIEITQFAAGVCLKLFGILKTYLSFLNYISSMSLAIALKVSSCQKRSFPVDGKCPSFSVQHCYEQEESWC